MAKRTAQDREDLERELRAAGVSPEATAQRSADTVAGQRRLRVTEPALAPVTTAGRWAHADNRPDSSPRNNPRPRR
jgi:hypothetical protein